MRDYISLYITPGMVFSDQIKNLEKTTIRGDRQNLMQNYITAEIIKTRNTVDTVLGDSALLAEVEIIAGLVTNALKGGNKIMFAGNGGSAADSQHLAAELVSRLNYDRPGLAAIALTTDTSALTAIGNDYGFEHSFARQIEAVGRKGDILVAISTSGNSSNILHALEAARSREITTVGFTGKTGGKMPPLCDKILRIPSTETPKIQECHIMLGHIVCALAEDAIFAAGYKPAAQKEIA